MAKIVDRDEMKGRILEAALGVYQESGFHAASMNMVAKTAGLAKGTLYLYFKSKDEMTIALCHHLFSGVEKNFIHEELFDSLDEFSQFLFSTMDISQDHADFIPVFFEIFGPSFSSGELRLEVSAFFDKLGDFYACQIRHLQEKGQIGATHDPETTGRALAAALDGVILHRGLFLTSRSRYLQMIRSLLGVILNGLKL
ncbi:MAG TPA: TetR/AcrR family transcriptional regulator [Rhizobiales bacterium]|nr:TetR/AcrR family transcriptional regulator [Hyphomicrobiales bacterium]